MNTDLLVSFNRGCSCNELLSTVIIFSGAARVRIYSRRQNGKRALNYTGTSFSCFCNCLVKIGLRDSLGRVLDRRFLGIVGRTSARRDRGNCSIFNRFACHEVIMRSLVFVGGWLKLDRGNYTRVSVGELEIAIEAS